MALEAMAEKAAACGLTPVIATTGQQGETGEAARTRAREILYKQYMEYNVIILGGETTPVLPENIVNPLDSIRKIKEEYKEIGLPSDMVVIATGTVPCAMLYYECLSKNAAPKIYNLGVQLTF